MPANSIEINANFANVVMQCKRRDKTADPITITEIVVLCTVNDDDDDDDGHNDDIFPYLLNIFFISFAGSLLPQLNFFLHSYIRGLDI